MTFFFLPKQHPQTLESLPDGQFYTEYWSQSYTVKVPHGCAPVWCEYTGDWTNEGHSWKNPISGQDHTIHPLFLTTSDGSFFEGFYEITTIEGLTFGEGEAWCPATNSKIPVEKTDQRSIWNPFFQRYDPPCKCGELHRINYDFENNTYHVLFDEIMNEFEKVYCAGCFRCEFCHEIHTSMYHCLEECRI